MQYLQFIARGWMAGTLRRPRYMSTVLGRLKLTSRVLVICYCDGKTEDELRREQISSQNHIWIPFTERSGHAEPLSDNPK